MLSNARGTSTRPASVCAVVVTFNRRQLLKECLTALSKQTRVLDKVVVVDNGSTDGTLDMVTREFPHVLVISTKQNLGGAGGFHVGIKWACERGFDWVWVMDDDAEPAHDALMRLLERPEAQPADVGILAPVVVGEGGYVQTYHHKKVDFLLRERSVFGSQAILVDEMPCTDKCVTLDATCFVGAMIRCSAVRECGLPNPNFFYYADDLEYTYRVSRRFRVLLVPSARIYHKDNRAARSPSRRIAWDRYWRQYYAIRNTLHFRMQYLPWYLRVLICGSAVYRLVRSLLAIIVFDDHKFRRIRVLWKAYIDGMSGKLGRGPYS